ncbi:MAG: SOS response-associated peptidase, partial [Fibrobacteria bacterium]|nr:SOS response-associated peptidase [Fibrobacteria bacterium]
FKMRRCVIVADGFYEWRKVGRKKVPYYICLKHNEPMLFAGIYDHWKKPEGSYLSTFAIATVPANTLMAQIHNDKQRMPALLLSQDIAQRWLDNSVDDTECLLPLLTSAPDGVLQAHVVGKEVGSPQNNHEGLTELVDKVYIQREYGYVPGLE